MSLSEGFIDKCLGGPHALEDEFMSVVLGGEPSTRHAFSNGRTNTFTVCGSGGWCGTDEQSSCPDCLAIIAGTAEPLPQPW